MGFGTASLHRIYTSRKRISLLSKSAESGITHFDTAPYYGYGLAETDLGKFLKGRRDRFTVASKVGLYPYGPSSTEMASVLFRKMLGKVAPGLSLPVVNLSVQRARDSLRESLRRLHSEYLDFLLLHEPQMNMLHTDEMFKWMQEETCSGLVRAWGISGIRERVEPFVDSLHPIASVVQTRDSNDLKEADFLIVAGRPLQFTYGYLSGAIMRNGLVSTSTEITLAMSRNTTGCILISVGNGKHLDEIANSFV